MSKNSLAIILIVLFLSASLAYFSTTKKVEPIAVSSFDECVAAGNPVAESYPEQCFHEGEGFVRDIGNELEKIDLIRTDSPRPGEAVSNPLVVRGEARGYWFFEATAPVIVLDSDGNTVGEGYIEAVEGWMTEDFVPFQGEITFDLSHQSREGRLILKRHNASGLPEHDDSLEFPILFK